MAFFSQALQQEVNPPKNPEENPYSKKEIFLQAQELTNIKPLKLYFMKGEYQLGNNTRTMIEAWAKQIKNSTIPIYIYSLSTAPRGLRNLTQDAATHEAKRTAFNRGLLIKSLLLSHDIAQDQLIIKTNRPESVQINKPFRDIVIITTRRH